MKTLNSSYLALKRRQNYATELEIELREQVRKVGAVYDREWNDTWIGEIRECMGSLIVTGSKNEGHDEKKMYLRIPKQVCEASDPVGEMKKMIPGIRKQELEIKIGDLSRDIEYRRGILEKLKNDLELLDSGDGT